MTDAFIDDHLEFHEWWRLFGDRERRNDRLAKYLTPEKEQWIATTYSEEVFKKRNKAIWKACEDTGVPFSELVRHSVLDPRHLKRKLDNGLASEAELWLIVNESGLDLTNIMSSPSARHAFTGKIRTVHKFKHVADTVDLPISESVRTPFDDTLSPSYAALMSALFCDLDNADKWFYLAVPVAHDLTLIRETPELAAFVERIFTTARQVECLDDEDIESLVQWSPRRAGGTAALGYIAKVWNRYQMHWFVASEVIGSI